jgi:hypothetical protein
MPAGEGGHWQPQGSRTQCAIRCQCQCQCQCQCARAGIIIEEQTSTAERGCGWSSAAVAIGGRGAWIRVLGGVCGPRNPSRGHYTTLSDYSCWAADIALSSTSNLMERQRRDSSRCCWRSAWRQARYVRCSGRPLALHRSFAGAVGEPRLLGGAASFAALC